MQVAYTLPVFIIFNGTVMFTIAISVLLHIDLSQCVGVLVLQQFNQKYSNRTERSLQSQFHFSSSVLTGLCAKGPVSLPFIARDRRRPPPTAPRERKEGQEEARALIKLHRRNFKYLFTLLERAISSFLPRP